MATDPTTKQHYDKNADNYHRHVSDAQESIYHSYYEKPAIQAALPDLSGKKVISIGCGSGVDARWIKDNGAAEVVGIDLSDNLIAIAKAENPDILFKQMDMEQLAFPDESFDLAYSSLAIHYIDDWTTPLKEALRVLKAGGSYVFSCGHPIMSAMDYGDSDNQKHALLGKKINEQSEERRIFGDYMVAADGGVKGTVATIANSQLVVYHRSISAMIAQIQASGFEIVQMIEPLPIESLKSHDPFNYDLLMRIPAFIIWKLQKPTV